MTHLLVAELVKDTPQSPDPNIDQRAASNPDVDVWVSASAGSGKTKVLTDRVLRLLLPDPDNRYSGAKPHKILCITFTKAAAAEMALRVQKRLAEWAMMDEDALREDLKEKLLGFAPPQHMMDAARRLFSEVLDVPNGLAIMTIHSFCQSILGRFPIEAGVTPQFQVMDEAKADDALSKVVTDTIRHLQTGAGDTDFRESFERLAIYKDIESLQDILQKLLSDTWRLKGFLGRHASRESILAKLFVCLDISADTNAAVIWQKSMEYLNIPNVLHIAKTLGTAKGVNDQNVAQDLATWLAVPEDKRQESFYLLKEAFFTKKNTPRKINSATKDPALQAQIDDIIHVIAAYEEQFALLTQAQQTADLLTITAYCLDKYEQRKHDLNTLDFSDLIIRTRQLLESQHLEWVHYKLDEGIDHILVDEAQDTNTHQWEIVRLLSEEFQAGAGREIDQGKGRPRSLFVVGDEKQSIFSFHGADPEAFQKMQAFFHKRSVDAGRAFQSVRLETSFRTTRPLLQLVDSVFAPPNMAAYLGLAPDYQLVHYSKRPKDAGRAECWDLGARTKQDKDKGPAVWKLPPVSQEDSQENNSGRGSTSSLAMQMALHIAGLLNGKEKLLSENRNIEPRDMLVLVRTRSAFVGELVRHLKRLNIPVSGVDRMKLNDQIAIMDCLALAKFARFPKDDLSLACVLRSPFIRMSEDELMALSLGRQGSLWDAVQHSGRTPVIRWLQRVIARASLKKPFEFFDEILNEAAPRSEFISCWQAFAQDLGQDCRDPLEEFLGHCLRAEADGVFGLEEFLVSFQKKAIEIKRDVEGNDKDTQNQVRIMTVHASKGLEAPIVFLPDTVGYPSRGKLDTLQWLESREGSAFPLWSVGPKSLCQVYIAAKDKQFQKAIAEYHRLLYVALTRARDRLYIMGEQKLRGEPNPDCWYHAIVKGFTHLGAESDGMSAKRILESKQAEPVAVKTEKIAIYTPAVIPAWLHAPPASVDVATIHIINPSRLGNESGREGEGDGASGREPIMSPIYQRDTHRFLRGNLSHRLFEILPDIPAALRENVGQKYLERLGSGLEAAIRADILREVLVILNDPVFAHVFGPNSRAEVPISGPMGKGQVINGQIDRLVVTDTHVLVVDFKTNRPSPNDQSQIPKAYRAQLAAYKGALQLIYPEKIILCALLWTDKPLLMPIEIA